MAESLLPLVSSDHLNGLALAVVGFDRGACRDDDLRYFSFAFGDPPSLRSWELAMEGEILIDRQHVRRF